MSEVGERKALWNALRWQLWLRAFALAGLLQNVLTLIGGNWFNRLPAWELSICHWQLTHDPDAGPLSHQRRDKAERAS